MANMCMNIVTFSGENARKAIEYFKFQQDKIKFDIHIMEEDLSISFETKYTPIVDFFVRKCKRLKVDMIYQYEELGYYIYGESLLIGGKKKTFEVSESDFKKIKKDGDWYIYKRKDYECIYDILDQMIDKKKKEYFKHD